MATNLWSNCDYDQGLGSPTGTIPSGEDVNHETLIPFDPTQYFDPDFDLEAASFGDSQEGGSQIHEPWSPSQTQPSGDQHHVEPARDEDTLGDQHHEEPARDEGTLRDQHHEEELARDEDNMALAGDNCMQSILPRPPISKHKRPCEQSRTKSEPSRCKGRRGRSGEAIIITEKTPRSPRKRHGKKQAGKRIRGRNWEHEEVASFLKLKLSASNSGNRITDWKLISRKLKEDSSITRTPSECERQWGTAMKSCRKLKGELESKNIDEGDQSGWKSFWEEKEGTTFNLECFELVCRILATGTQIDSVKKQKVHGPQAFPASTSRAPPASSTRTSENLDNSEGHGNEQRSGSSIQWDTPMDSLVELLAPGGAQDRTNKQITDVVQLQRNMDSPMGQLWDKRQRQIEQWKSKEGELKSKGIECNLIKVKWELNNIEWERIKIERDKIREELDSTTEELMVDFQKQYLEIEPQKLANPAPKHTKRKVK